MKHAGQRGKTPRMDQFGDWRTRAARYRSWVACVLALLAYAGWIGSASAKQLYEFVDENGVRHFSDTAPDTDAPVKSTRIQVEERPLMRLAFQSDDGRDSTIIIHNLIAGPIEVELRLGDVRNATPVPSLPRRFVLEAGASLPAVKVTSADPRRDASFRAEAKVIPGDPRVRVRSDVRYRLPLPSGTRFAVGQAFGGRFSHNDEQNYHAVDLGVAEGTPILAARDGVVVQVERDFFESGRDRTRLAGRANYVRIMHEDGTMAVYAHLAYESVLVEPGDVVLTGQRIGSAGATGFATGPHLHFVVQWNGGLLLESIPFQFDGPDGPYTPERSRVWQHAP